jgi:hypothetical protein
MVVIRDSGDRIAISSPLGAGGVGEVCGARGCS